MERNGYTFLKYSSSFYEVDPVFKTNNFTLFGDPEHFANDSPDLFEVYIGRRRFSYCLINPRKISKNEEMLLKIKRYLFNHEDNEDLDNPINTYFIGDTQKSIDVSNGFTNQNIILVTYEMIEQWYPKSMNDIFKLIIIYILKNQSHLGQQFSFISLDDDVVFANPSLKENEKREYKLYLLECMKEEGLVSIINNGISIDCFVLTAKAIDSIERKTTETNKTAFIAIKFDGNEERINTIQNAIAEAGYEPVIMNQVETNNWIMPEIFYRIKNCRFVVADFSIKCDGAYYEAGYAAALDKPVIHLFDKREEREDNKLHFDIAQKSTIIYSNYQELKQRLFDRIKATIK